jgi:hypothetical protein
MYLMSITRSSNSSSWRAVPCKTTSHADGRQDGSRSRWFRVLSTVVSLRLLPITSREASAEHLVLKVLNAMQSKSRPQHLPSLDAVALENADIIEHRVDRVLSTFLPVSSHIGCDISVLLMFALCTSDLLLK